MQAHGVCLRISGADIIAEGAEVLSAPLQAALRTHTVSGQLWAYLGSDADESEPVALLHKLKVAVMLVETRPAARAAIRQLIRDRQQHPGPLGLDIETAPLRSEPRWLRLNKDGTPSARQWASADRSGLNPHLARIATLQLHAGGDAAFVFRGEALDLLLRSRWLRRQWLVAYNASFDTAFLRQHTHAAKKFPEASSAESPNGCDRFRLECTMQATGLVLGVGAGGSRSLANAAKKFLGLDVPKALRCSDWSAARLTPGQLAYAAVDAVLTWRLWPVLTAAIQANDTCRAYELQRDAVAAVADMERRGLGFDKDEHTRQVDAWERELAEAQQQYREATGTAPPSTPNEIRTWLSTALDTDVLARWPRTARGKSLSVESNHLKRLTHIPATRAVLAMLAHAKLLSTFGPRLAKQINPVTKRLHAHYSIAGSKSGRFTCNHPNLQQLPNARAPEFKRCIIAAPGHVLVCCDWNQIELRAAAWLSKDPELTRIYDEGCDLHRESGATIAGIAPEQVTREQRQAAKAVNFGALYGIRARGLAEYAFASYGVEMTEAAANHALDAFFERFPALDRWRRNNAYLCQRCGFVRIGAGRIVKAAWEPGGRLSFQQCCNLPVQGICADAMLRAIALVHARFAQAGIRGGLVATMHDELLAEVVEAAAAKAREILEQAMLDAFVATFPGAPTMDVAAAKIGRTWTEAKG